MRPLAPEEIVDLERYAALRPAYRDAVIAHKRQRRVAVGEKVTLLFEDRETLRFQVQEMLWVERIAQPEKVQHELDVYNALMPGDCELSATLFIELPDLERIRSELDRLLGIDEHVALVLGDGEAGDEDAVRARFDPDQLEEDRISAVHYLRFVLSQAQAARLADPRETARLRIDHPHYTQETELAPEVRASLAAGLRAAPEPLLPAGGEPAPQPPADEVLFATGRVRALRPGRPAGRYAVVEPVTGASLLDADPELLAELMQAVRRVAADALRTAGGCRIVAEVREGEPLRWHVLAAPPPR